LPTSSYLFLEEMLSCNKQPTKVSRLQFRQVGEVPRRYAA
jgi:hypothetical protein